MYRKYNRGNIVGKTQSEFLDRLQAKYEGVINNGDEVIIEHLDLETRKIKKTRGYIDFRSCFPESCPIVLYARASYSRALESIIFSGRSTILPRYLKQIKLIKTYPQVFREKKKLGLTRKLKDVT